MRLSGRRQHFRMGLLNTVFAAASGLSGIVAGRAAGKEVKHLLKIAKITLICVAVLAVVFSLCLLSIGAYTAVLLVKEVVG